MTELEGTPLPEVGEWREKTIAMLKNPGSWPHWPVLPMKRRYEGEGGPRVDAAGYSVTADYPTIVLRGFPTTSGVLEQLAVENGTTSIGTDYEGRIVKRYESIEQMLDDGWAID